MFSSLALQVSDQCVKLYKEGWFRSQPEPSGILTLVDPRVYSPLDTVDIPSFAVLLAMKEMGGRGGRGKGVGGFNKG